MPVTPKEFRQIALSFPETEARQHMGHPDFRVAGKIFATLGYPDKSFGMVKLTPVEQRMFMDAEPKAFQPAAGAWGRQGSTTVKLSLVGKATLRRAITAAWEFAAGAGLAKAKSERKSGSSKPDPG
ncbi:MAG TPA: MmcQ/YjbR family DNA-binding protein, partial [Candidatus Acidoferrum sp.]|nr:MmcQ/YjbR family DNA-binding protein [Candidatus Acidoferrum sp.]